MVGTSRTPQNKHNTRSNNNKNSGKKNKGFQTPNQSRKQYPTAPNSGESVLLGFDPLNTSTEKMEPTGEQPLQGAISQQPPQGAIPKQPQPGLNPISQPTNSQPPDLAVVLQQFQQAIVSLQNTTARLDENTNRLTAELNQTSVNQKYAMENLKKDINSTVNTMNTQHNIQMENMNKEIQNIKSSLMRRGSLTYTEESEQNPSGENQVHVSDLLTDTIIDCAETHQPAPIQNRNWPNPLNGSRHTQPQNVYVSDRMRVDKWGLRFDGRTGLSVTDFIFRLETMQRQYRYPWEEVLRDFTTFVAGDANKCYWKFLKSNQTITWPNLKAALLHRFGSRKMDLDIWREMTERKQGPKEKFVEFYDGMLDLREKLTKDLPDADVIKLIKQNASRFIRNMVYPQAINTIEELFEACIEVETAFSQTDQSNIKRNPQNSFPTSKTNPKTVFAVEEDEEEDRVEEEEDVAAIDFNKSRPPQHQKQKSQHQKLQPNRQNENQPQKQAANAQAFKCYNCQETGHGFFSCPHPRKDIFCFKCGLNNYILPQCPNCNQGNCQQRVKPRAISHSVETQTQSLPTPHNQN